MKILKNALVYDNFTRSFIKNDLKISNGKVTDIGRLPSDGGEIIDLEGFAVTAGLIDVHTHGRIGFDFVSIPSNKLPEISMDYAKHGVTTVMPTIASAPFEQMLNAIEKINKFTPCGGADFCGVHIEGRYLSLKYKGAHAKELLSPLSPDELDAPEIKNCKALHISAAFEQDPNGDFAKKALSIGATLALAHTSASYEESVSAEKRGVTAYTHLFNAMPSMHHRNGGAVCAALTGKCFAELICDGIHISPQMIRLAYSSLTSKRTVLITDSMEAASFPDGEYSIAGVPVTVKNGLALTHNGAIAGSTLSLNEAVRNFMKFTEAPLTEAILCATENPARQIGIFEDRGSIEIGKRADLLVLRSTKELDIARVMVNGEFI